MRVSELAARAGTTAKTIRFYEAEGILPVPARQANAYRHYGEVDLCRLRVVVSLRNLGLSLGESGRLAELCATGQCADMAGDLVGRLAERRAEVAAAMTELAHLDAELETVQRSLAAGATPTTCCAAERR